MATHLEKLGFHSIWVTSTKNYAGEDPDNDPNTFEDPVAFIMRKIGEVGTRYGFSVWDLSEPSLWDDGTILNILDEATGDPNNWTIMNESLFVFLEDTGISMVALD